MKQALILFVRQPQLGKVKTRLAATLGDEKALFIYQKLLNHTLFITQQIPCDKFVFYANEIPEIDMWNQPGYFKHKQSGDTLGRRMQAAFEEVFDKGYTDVCIAGSDCYELTTNIINEAFQLLSNHDVVIGPAKDGGYYLLGMKALHLSFFHNKEWSTSWVFENTVHDVQTLSLSYAQLPLLSDVDKAADVPPHWLL